MRSTHHALSQFKATKKWRRHAECRATYQLPSTQQKLRQPIDRRSHRIAAISA
jgi:hypothetical protein